MRTTIVSTSKLKTNNILGIGIIVSLLAIVLTNSIVQIFSGRPFEGLFTLPIWIWIAYKAISLMLSLKNISYDESSVYYEKDGFEVQIPFEDIKDIEIKTLTGIYTINLYRPAQDGKAISFKMSLWYPLNFKKQDEIVNNLRDKIDRYKRTLQERNFAGLPSYNI